MRYENAQFYTDKIQYPEKYSRGWRGAPAKGVGRATGARVQIPLSPFLFLKKLEKIKTKKCLTLMSFRDKLAELLKKRRFWKRKTKNKLKKLLTSKNAYDKIYELSLRQQRTLKTEQYVKPWKF